MNQSFNGVINLRQRGFSMMALLIMIPSLLLLTGTAVTVTVGLNTQHQLGLASESAAMYFAKRKALTGKLATVDLVRQFMSQFTFVGKISEVEVIALTNGYRVKATSTLPIFMMPSIGDNFEVSNQGAAEIDINLSEKVDIVLLLDLSSSQNRGLSNTISELHRVVADIEQRYEPGNIRIGIMAFSFLPSIADADWLPESFQGIECVSATVYKPGLFSSTPTRSNEQAVVDNIFTLPNDLLHIDHSARALDTTWLEEGCPDVSSLLPTADLEAVRDKISEHEQPSNVSMTIYHHGLIFAARMLDDDWAQEWDNAQEDIGERTKAIIAIGDGADGGVYRYEFAAMIEAGLCDSIRENNIDLYHLYYGSDYRAGSNIEQCVTQEKSSSLTELDQVIDQLIERVNPNNNQKNVTLKLIP